MEKFSYLKSTNVDYIDELFARYAQDPMSIDPSWRYFFEGLELGTEAPPAPVSEELVAAPSAVDLLTEAKVAELIQTYRTLGHVIADVNPLAPQTASHPSLELSRFGLSDADLNRTFHAGKLIGLGAAKLSEIIAKLRQTYCRAIGVEFTHIQNQIEREWLQSRMESAQNLPQLDTETRKFILKRLVESENFERFLHTRYVAQKRFSVEGGESVIPSLDCLIETAADFGARSFVMGMAHRGRLNVLVNILRKKPEYILTQFEGNYRVDLEEGEGDVKYHMGYSADFKTRSGKETHLSMAYNPSHLEFVNPVVEGITRAKQTHLNDSDRTQVVPILIHGDAAFAGQGVCYETLNLSQLTGYKTGGTLHIVINNQVGFTTSPKDSRSTTYSTDGARMLEVPIFHVNGDDPEAVWYVSKICAEYRQKFKKDVFIDLVCYRRHGHNEGDEPTFTQPILYKKIKAHPTTREIYAQKLIAQGIVTEKESQSLLDDNMNFLTGVQTQVKAEEPQPITRMISTLQGNWKGLKRVGPMAHEELFKPSETAVPAEQLKKLAEKLNHIPESFHLHPKLARFFESRLKAIQEEKGIDWGNGEALAFGTLLQEGYGVRLSGQDAERGTFTHRHSVLNDFETGATYAPLNHIAPGQATYQVYNSELSETGVLGFEYGYSLADPASLVIWEAQFGDFANGAQVIIDQFISSSESKWLRMSGLTLLLPHGFEGQGPEHSSARLERFLQLCGKNNIQVCNLTTPAQLFHALRRQVKRDFRKPLVIMSPKSLLRHPLAVSSLGDFSRGTFQEVLDDVELSRDAKTSVKTVLLCSGKVYYDLIAERTLRKRNDVAIVRIEQLYPWPEARLNTILSQYKNAKKFVWVQEEPRNMGAWTYVFNQWCGGYGNFQEKVGGHSISYAGRDMAAAPAVGSMKVHESEQKALLEKAFG